MSVGNGSLTGRYKHYGYKVQYQIELQRGSTTHVGSGLYRFTLPVAANVWWATTGAGYCSNGDIPLTVRGINSTTIAMVTPDGQLSTTNPGGWSSGQYIVVQGTYPTSSQGTG